MAFVRFDHKALGRLPAGQMNKTETAYAQHLEVLKHTGDVLWYRFEGLKFRLADKTFLTPDFAVMNRNHVIELHDVKGGHVFDDAHVKMKVASSMYPFTFLYVRRRGSLWIRQYIDLQTEEAAQ